MKENPSAVASRTSGLSAPADTQVTDYSAAMRLTSSPLLRAVFAGLGLICVGFAIIGVILPGWPTTIWLLIAAWLFSKSSNRFYNRVLNHKTFGPIVRDYRAGNGVPARIRLIAISSIVLFAGSSAFLLIGQGWIRLAIVACAMFGIGFLTGLPTRSPYARSSRPDLPDV